MKIAFISAMIEEIEPILQTYDWQKSSIINSQQIYRTNFENNLDVYLLNTGVGKTNAAITTTQFILENNPDVIINIGTAGAINKNVAINDFVCASRLAYWDVDATDFGYQLGQVPKEDKYMEIDNTKFLNLIKDCNFNIHEGTILTGDSFISNHNLDKIKVDAFVNPLCCEMESMAIVQTAHKFNIPIYVLRTISDNAFINSHIEFDQYLSIVSKQYLTLFDLIIKNYGALINE